MFVFLINKKLPFVISYSEMAKCWGPVVISVWLTVYFSHGCSVCYINCWYCSSLTAHIIRHSYWLFLGVWSCSHWKTDVNEHVISHGLRSKFRHWGNKNNFNKLVMEEIKNNTLCTYWELLLLLWSHGHLVDKYSRLGPATEPSWPGKSHLSKLWG